MRVGATGKELFTAACDTMQPGRGWEECDQWVRDMWEREAAKGVSVADVRQAIESLSN